MRQETSDKDILQKPLHPRERSCDRGHVQGHVIDIVYHPRTRKPKSKPENRAETSPDKKIGFMQKKS